MTERCPSQTAQAIRCQRSTDHDGWHAHLTPRRAIAWGDQPSEDGMALALEALVLVRRSHG